MDVTAGQAWLDERAAANLFSGAALVTRAGETVFEHAAGLAHRGHGIPVSTTSRFGTASITKLVTAIAALRLVERGAIALDQPLVEVLPPEHRPSALTEQHTLHHLLSHTSGLANYHDDDATTWESFTSCWDRIPTYHLRRPADMLPLFADLPAFAAPGEVYRYGDSNFILAGLAIEAVTGRPYDEVATDEVLRPAGMVDTAFDAIDDEPARLATGYLVSDEAPERWRTNVYSVPAGGMPDGGLFSSTHDLARLIDALLAGEMLAAETVELMTTPRGPASDDVEQYGYGCKLVVEDGAVTIIGHGGSDPGVSGLVSHHLASATTIVVLCNHDRGSWAATQHLTAALGLHDPRE